MHRHSGIHNSSLTLIGSLWVTLTILRQKQLSFINLSLPTNTQPELHNKYYENQHWCKNWRTLSTYCAYCPLRPAPVPAKHGNLLRPGVWVSLPPGAILMGQSGPKLASVSKQRPPSFGIATITAVTGRVLAANLGKLLWWFQVCVVLMPMVKATMQAVVWL